MKKNYFEVELEIISLVEEDVITTSNYGYNEDMLGDGNEDWNW